MRLAGWGRFPVVDAALVSLRALDEAAHLVGRYDSLIARGNGRSYGDAALNATTMLSTLRADRLRAFDPVAGTVTCEAGVLIGDLIAFTLPRGWFPSVTPGTKFATIGGLIAADAHGKNHHALGTFGNHVRAITLMLADGSVRQCSREQEAELFHATCGGMGLTGLILTAELALLPVESASIYQETLRADSLDEVMALFEDSAGWPYSVAWIDCLAQGARLGRSLLYRGRHAHTAEAGADPLRIRPRRQLTMPVDLPGVAMNRWSVGAFNALYFAAGKPGTTLIDYDRYFYPLDAIAAWNRIYGRAGFTQYQCVLPLAASRAGLTLLLERIKQAGTGAFLAVLKRMGPEGDGLLSFPLEGYTLALDFPMTPTTLGLLDELDAIVRDHGGRLYLAKDARQSAAMLRAGYPRLDRFRALRASVDPVGRFNSLLSRRLGL